MDRREIEATFTDAARAALARYPFEVTSLELVALSENVTFRVDTATDGSYVLRLHRPGYHSLPELHSERVWLRALAEAGIAVPIPVVSADGSEYVSVSVAVTEEQRFVGLSANDRDVLLAARAQIRQALDRYGQDPATFSLIHADLHHANLLVNDRGLSIIDFDDAGFGWHQYDIAVALFHSAATRHQAVAREAFFDGYRSSRPLSEADRALVPMFELVRGMAVIGWKMQRPEVQWKPGFFDAVRSSVLRQCAEFDPPC